MRLDENPNRNFYLKNRSHHREPRTKKYIDSIFLKDQSIFKNWEIFILP